MLKYLSFVDYRVSCVRANCLEIFATPQFISYQIAHACKQRNFLRFVILHFSTSKPVLKMLTFFFDVVDVC